MLINTYFHESLDFRLSLYKFVTPFETEEVNVVGLVKIDEKCSSWGLY